MEIHELVAELYRVKQDEQNVRNKRMALESELARVIDVPDDWEGTKTNTVGDYKVKLMRKMNVKIDGAKLTELASQHNLAPLLNTCFRWKPELNKREWDKVEADIKTKLSEAMEVTPGKASFIVTPEGEGEE